MKKTFRKLFFITALMALMTVLFCFGASAKTVPASGSCGKNVTYTYNSSTGELVISGSGVMTDYSYRGSPFYYSDIKSVVIKEGVTTIGKWAFEDCTNLQSITIPDSVTTIGEHAFESCYSLQSITIPDSVTTIGSGAFYYCYSLQSVTIPDSVTTIGSYAFEDCNSLQSVTIPDSVTTIGSSAFASCYSLQSVTIGNSVTTIGEYAFYYCDSLQSITIPDSVTTIGEYAFDDCDSLQSITIPDSVTTIGSYAFCSCDSLQSVTVDRNNKYYCNDDYGVLFNKNKTKLVQYPIGNKRTAYTIPDSVTTIGSSAFWSCDSLQSITIPDSVTTIGSYAFWYCYSLKNITVDKNNKYYCNDDYGILFDKNKTKLIQYPIGNTRAEYTIPDSVTTIDSYAFSSCYSLQSITIPDSMTTIGDYAFSSCYSLKDVYYCGTEEQWKKISIGSNNSRLTGATIHYLGATDPSDFGYKLRLRSDGAYSDSIALGEKITLWTFLYNNGERENCNRAYAISFDKTGIFEVTNTKKTTNSFNITLKAKKAGTANMTVSDSKTGAYVTMKLKANNPADVLTFDEVKAQAKKYEGTLTNFYDYNGLYVNNFLYSEKDSDFYSVQMNVYNEKAHYGVVASYYENGTPCKYEIIEPMDKLPTHLWDALFDLFDRVNYEFEVLRDKSYTDPIRSKWTPVNIKVPKGGYIKITNDFNDNEYVTFVNSVDLAIEIYSAKKGVKDLLDPEAKKDVIEMTIAEVIKKIGYDGFKSACSDVFKTSIKEITAGNIDEFLKNLIKVFTKFDIDLEKIVKESIDMEFGLNFAEDVALFLLGGEPVKKVLEKIGYVNTCIKIYDIGCSVISSEIIIYSPQKVSKVRQSNGVTVTSESELASDCVLHTYVINENDGFMNDASPTMDKLNSNYEMYDITLYKSSQAVKPDAKITVMIPIPEGYNKNNIQVFWYKDDGTLQTMNAVVKGDYAVFETDHLSYYVLVEDHKCTYEEVTVTAATYGKAGVKAYQCVCGNTEKTEPIPAVKSLTLSKTKYIYDGKNKTPKVTIKDSEGKVLTKNVDYKLTVASKRAGIGRYTVKVIFMGNYSGTKNLYFYILPGAPATVKSASQGTTSNKLTWSSVPGATGYTLYYYSNSKKAYKKINTTTNTSYTVKGLLTGTKYTFKVVAYGTTAAGKVYDSETYALLKSATKTKTPELTKVTASSTKGKAYVYHTDVKGETGYTVYYSTSSATGFKKYNNFNADTTSATITGLTSGKTYYFKIRTYIKTDSGYVYSPWSAVKSVKVK